MSTTERDRPKYDVQVLLFVVLGCRWSGQRSRSVCKFGETEFHGRQPRDLGCCDTGESGGRKCPISVHRSLLPPLSCLVKVALLDMKASFALHEMDEGAATPVRVSEAVAAVLVEIENWQTCPDRQLVRRVHDHLPRGSSPSCRHRSVYPSSPPTAGCVERTPSPPTRYLEQRGSHPMMLRGSRDRSVPPRPLRYVCQYLWVLLGMVVRDTRVWHVIVFPARRWLVRYEEYPSDRRWFGL